MFLPLVWLTCSYNPSMLFMSVFWPRWKLVWFSSGLIGGCAFCEEPVELGGGSALLFLPDPLRQVLRLVVLKQDGLFATIIATLVDALLQREPAFLIAPPPPPPPPPKFFLPHYCYCFLVLLLFFVCIILIKTTLNTSFWSGNRWWNCVTTSGWCCETLIPSLHLNSASVCLLFFVNLFSSFCYYVVYIL